MRRLLPSMVFLSLLAGHAGAADPRSEMSARTTAPGRVVDTNPYLRAMADTIARDRQTARDAMVFLGGPWVRVFEFLWVQADNPNRRITRLLNESEDLWQARKEIHRFWMNNQPSVLTYERLNGAIDP